MPVSTLKTAATYLTSTDAALAIGISRATLRRWERRGLLVPVRASSGVRLYTDILVGQGRRLRRQNKGETDG
jgi:DNA-binding transcriptional MerR regulator